VRPAPVEHELAGISFGNNVAVRRKWRVALHREHDPVSVDRSPTGTWNAVLWRMDRVTSPLAGKVGNEQIQGRFRLICVLVNAEEEITRAQRVECIFRDREIGSCHGPHLKRK